jgi:hypothetical protein
MWTTLRSVILAAILAPAVLFLPPWPESADGAERMAQPIVTAAAAPSCERAAWPYNANCTDQSRQLRLVSTDRVLPAGGR